MAKTPKAPATVVTPDMIDRASRTSTVRDLVKLAEAFARAAAHGPFTVELPLLTSCAVTDKGYRRHNVPTGTRVTPDRISIGKRAGLIFVLPVVGEWVCDKGPVEWIELGWDDIINSLTPLADRIDGYLAGTSVKDIDTAVREAIATNPAMHKILSEGFVLAQQHKKENVVTDADQENPLWGQF